MIQKLTPLTKGSTAYQCKDFYYDGVRRITETIFRPELSFVMIDPSMVEEGSNGLEYVFVEKEQNDEAAKLAPEDEGMSPGGGGGVEEPIELIEMGQPEGEVWTDREYIYGTDYVDEFVAQVDRDETLIYLHQDANYNVVALTAGMAADPTIFLPPAGTLMSQYTWDPYGTVAAEDRAHIHAVNRIGHQGLFFERLDGGNDTPPLATNARGFYYNRNRLYSPSLGRFMQRDPNETAVPLMTALASNGDAMSVLLGGFEVMALYGDGANLYRYEGNNPVNGLDPRGLFTLIEMVGVQGFQQDMNAQTADQGFSIVQLLKGIIGLQNLKQMAFSDAADIDPDYVNGSELDDALNIYESYQTYQNVKLGAGIFKAGLAFAAAGFAAFATDGYQVFRRAKSTSLPSLRRLTIDWGHIFSGHIKGGSRVSPKKDLFPSGWSQGDIKRAVEEAYQFGKKIQTQGQRVLLRGVGRGKMIEMWIDVGTKTMETAYPIN